MQSKNEERLNEASRLQRKQKKRGHKTKQVCPAHLQLHWDAWTAHRVFLPCWEPVSLLHELHELHEERVRNPKAPTEAFERSGAGLHEAFLLQLEPPTRLPPVFALINTPPKNFVYKSGRGRAPAALLTLEPASHGLFVVCVKCGVFQIKTFPAPDFRQGPVPKITHIFGTGPCRKPVAGNFKPKMCYFRQRKKPKNSQNRKRAKKSLEIRQLKKRPNTRERQHDIRPADTSSRHMWLINYGERTITSPLALGYPLLGPYRYVRAFYLPTTCCL